MTLDARAQQVDALFTRWAKSDSPGCAVAVLQSDQIVYRQGYGMANLEYNIPITPATIFHVASVSKQFAAAAILLLQRDGLLSVTDDVRKTIPELHDFGTPITIDHLIHHTSGLRDQWELLIAAGWRMDDVITTDDILSLIFAQRELNFAPGAEYRYCNTGYTLLGLIVQRVSGKTLRQFCAERIFEPLGMSSTHFHDNYLEIVPNRAYSYSEKDGAFQHDHLLYSNVGATSLFTTVDDLLRWEANFFNPRVGDAAFIEQMKRPVVLNDGKHVPYASGVIVRDYRGLRVVEHSGGDAGYRTHVRHFPDQHLAVTVLCNLATMKPAQLAQQIADIYLADQMTASTEQPMMLPEADLQARAGWYHSAAVHETLHLTVSDQALQVSDWLKLDALDSHHFIGADSPAPAHLDFNEDGTALTFDDGLGRAVSYRRVDPLALTPASLSEYIGVYHCPELDVDYEIALEDDKLVLKRRKYGTKTLIAVLPDSFVEANTEFDLSFSRDLMNVVSGFKLSNGRVRNLSFVRKT